MCIRDRHRDAGRRPDMRQAQARGQVVAEEQDLLCHAAVADRRVAGADFREERPGRL